MDPKKLIDKYYNDNPALREILLTHCEQVAALALRIVDAHPELGADRQFVWEGAMLHDIGVFKCDAEALHCHGTARYIQHGILGAELLRAEGLPQHARVAERHTGTGITVNEIMMRQLPLPLGDYMPETIEEKIICYADKFYSKTKLDREKTYEEVRHSIIRFGGDSLYRLERMHEKFEL